MKKIIPLICSVLTLGLLTVSAQVADQGINIIPRPASLEIGKGSYQISPDTHIVCDEKSRVAALLLAESIQPALGYKLLIKDSIQNSSKSIIFKTGITDLKGESYRLKVDENKILIESADERGAIYGVQSLRQLLPVEAFNKVKTDVRWNVPSVTIVDTPRFTWRGLMVDSSRTFWSVEFMKRYIDLLSLYKINVLHMHLCDDQGWRLEIKKYPKLTQIGSKFAAKYNEPPEREGFYTQEQIRELVAYGQARNVTLVPEIEMPGHVLALLNSYPELVCPSVKKLRDIHPFVKGPTIHKEILCAGNPKTFEILKGIIDEVVELFPSEYIHIGGDEAPKDSWKKCEKCQALIKKESLRDEHHLQSWFISKMGKYITSKGKKYIGWSEIFEGGLAPEAAVMDWIGGGKKAAKAKHYAVMTPTSHCYFDYPPQKYNSKRVYSYEPIPAGLTKEEEKFILGAQGNFWSHYKRTEAGFDSQIFPRLRALAEVTWTPKDKKNWGHYSKRAKYDLQRLNKMGVKYFHEKAPKATTPATKATK